MNVTPLSPALGANIDGVDLAAVTDAEFETIYQAWLDHGVLRIRGQSLDDPQLERFSARFGPLEKIPVKLQWAYVMGMEVDESEALLDELWSYAALPENVWTQKWTVGDVLIWDNRRVLHRRDAFPDHLRRLMKRCQVLAREG